MIGRLRGILAYKQPPYLMIDVQGVSYDVQASLSTFSTLPEVGVEIALYTHLAVREDAHVLYGFASLDERGLFRNLIKVSGIGAKLALLILSGMSVESFTRCVHAADAAALARLPGIGKKTAERLIVEMRDRIGRPESGTSSSPDFGGPPISPLPESPIEDAVSALVALGYKPPEATRMVRTLDCQGLASEEIIRLALQTTLRQ